MVLSWPLFHSVSLEIQIFENNTLQVARKWHPVPNYAELLVRHCLYEKIAEIHAGFFSLSWGFDRRVSLVTGATIGWSSCRCSVGFDLNLMFGSNLLITPNIHKYSCLSYEYHLEIAGLSSAAFHQRLTGKLHALLVESPMQRSL